MRKDYRFPLGQETAPYYGKLLAIPAVDASIIPLAREEAWFYRLCAENRPDWKDQQAIAAAVDYCTKHYELHGFDEEVWSQPEAWYFNLRTLARHLLRIEGEDYRPWLPVRSAGSRQRLTPQTRELLAKAVFLQIHVENVAMSHIPVDEIAHKLCVAGVKELAQQLAGLCPAKLKRDKELSAFRRNLGKHLNRTDWGRWLIAIKFLAHKSGTNIYPFPYSWLLE